MTDQPSETDPDDKPEPNDVADELGDSQDLHEFTEPSAAESKDAPAEPSPTDEPAPDADPPVSEGPGPGTKRRGRRRKKRKKPPWWEMPALVLGAIAIAILVKSFVVQPFYIPSESMEMTLAGSAEHGHDRILVNKVEYDFSDPDPGDIVVFHAPPGWDDEQGTKPPSNPVVRTVRGFGQLIGVVPPDGLVLVKRVIAVGGQTVRGLVQDGKAIVQVSNDDGRTWRTLNETYVHLSNPELYPNDEVATFGPVTVPKDRLWVMGDHRDDSQDSRFHCAPDGQEGPHDENCSPIGSTVPISKVIGRAFVVAWPISHWRTLGTPSTFESAMGLAGREPIAVGAAAMAPVFLIRRRRRRIR